jgi:hypothetical protein
MSDAEARAQAKERLKAVGLALHEYDSAYQQLPAGVACKPNKEHPTGVGLSWRVQLLPYLGQEGLFKEFKLDEPWDSEHNKALVPKMPEVFASPGKEARAGLTYLRAFSGPSAFLATSPQGPPAVAGRPIHGRRLLFPDGYSNTLLAAEADTPVIWTRPDELPFDGTATNHDAPLPKLGGVFPDGFHGLLGDGRPLFFPKTLTTDSMVRKAITVDGAERDELEPIFKENGMKR